VHAQKGQQHPIEKSRELQRKLYRAAKKCRDRRFHALYDRVFRPDVLWRAWQEVRANGGSAGIDGVTLEDVERLGVAEFLQSIGADLKARRYRPKPVLRVYIPKPDGRQRPLGIPTVRDRVVQQACKIVIEPIFEANFQDQSYGFRPKRSAAQAVRKIDAALVRGWWVVDADIQGYLDAASYCPLVHESCSNSAGC
jgi:group II intron reverse transcriptase/maturase